MRSGETWRIALASEDADASGQPFTLSWEIRDRDPLAQYRNSDFFADAIPIGGAEGRARNLLTNEDGARYMYTVEASEPPETGIATGWWQWTAPGDGRFTWRMDGSTAYQLTIFTGDALDNLQLVGTLRGGSALVIDAAANTRYRIAVGRSPAEVGTASVRPSAFGWGMTPANDDRADAAPITGGAGSAEASLVHASGEANEPRSAVGLDSVWWNWRAPAAGWYRFTVEGNPLHAIVQIFPGGNSGAASSQVIGDSERSFLANGRVDVHVLVREGERFDIRLSRRPGVRLTGSDRLVWAPSATPAYLSYKGAVTEELLIANPVFDGSWSPRHLAMTDDGMYLFSTAKGQLLGFVRDGDSGELALAYRASADSNRETLDPSRLRPDSHALWWSPVNETLFALTLCGAPYSFALPDAGTTLDVRRTEIIDFPGSPSCRFLAAQGDHGGSHLYTTDDSRQRLQVFRADSATTLTHVQTISAVAATGEDHTVVPNLISPVDLALASDGRHLYLVDEFGLFVFSRDPSSGRLAPAGRMPLTNDPEGPFYEMRSLRHATVDADGAVLFVAGSHSEDSVIDTAVAAFDISADPANPAHLDTLTGFYFHEADRGTLNAWNHLQVRPNAFSRCDKPLAHGGLLAIDVFCTEGYFVVRWNPEASALEVTDFAFSGDRDRFGNLVPFLGYWDRRMAQSPDGAHAYRTTHWQDQGQSSAIHIFERASAMSTDDETAPPTDSVTDSSPIFAAGSGPGDQFYTIGTAIGALALPTASGGDGSLTYSLAPAVPGLNFNATATVRRLTGTPTATGTYDMTYRVRDTDGDTDTLTFTITVKAGGGDHGDDRASATGVEPESDTEGVLESGDVDYFRIVVDASGTLEVYTSGRIDTRGWLEDTDGAVLGTNDDGGAGTNFRMSEDVSAGTYFVRVEGYSSGVTGGYTLHVRFTESDSGAGTDDRAALMALYDATDGSNWAIDSNWGSDSPLNSWHGVTADNSGRVTMIDLSSNQLSGSIPAELGDISNLEELWLYNNELSGPIPGELGDLSSLRLLILSLNQLSGSIPTGLGNLSNLELLSLNANKLSGPVPAELNGLSSLEELDLSSNQLSGSIPAELGDLPNLEELWLYSNELSGPIPGELGSLSDLRIMSLSLNRLSGSIPAGLGNLSNLELLSLNANKLSGPIPAELSGLSNLEDLDLSSNQLSGSIPAELGDLSGLEALWLYGNELSGSIPGELGGLFDLQIMSLSLNRLSGSIPAGLGNLSNLELLSLSDNELSGSIPTELSGLSSLEHLDLSSNQLSGSIPAELGDLSNLEALWLYGNELSGSIPAALSDLSSLEFLYLGGNQLSGCIPDR
ncbi:MAG: leucine-rich repeat domain-containing protein, partial [Rhodospirillaceae bacterium]|nr:leucine-rich repeat domain-containing protein [Rhodospirillaceae bacterium]